MPKPPAPQRSGIVVPHRPVWHQRLAAALIVGLVRLVACTVRFQWHDNAERQSRSAPAPIVFCTWHNRLALCLEVFRSIRQRTSKERRLAAMVSASKDGGLLARVLELNGVQPVRGSTSRRGRQALLELVSWAERGHDLAITPDGPRGPCYKVQEGIMALAQVTGRPIMGISYYMSWKITLKSWDRFQIPLPFTKCVVDITPAIEVPRDATDAQREELRQELERQLQAITRD